VALVSTDVSDERVASIIRVRRISQLSDFITLMMEAKRSSETSVFRKATGRHTSEDTLFLVRFDVFTAVTMKKGVF
jgi:hypothetical protein